MEEKEGEKVVMEEIEKRGRKRRRKIRTRVPV